jgi:hypothetical protein
MNAFAPLAAAAFAASPSPAAMTAPSSTAIVTIPPSWHSVRWSNKRSSFARVLGVWKSGNETISLREEPSLGESLQQITESWLKRTTREFPTLTLNESGSLRLCHNRSGLKAVYSDPSGSGVTYVAATTQTRIYVVAYEYSRNGGVSAAGTAAAESLCPPPDPVVQLPPAPITAPDWPSRNPDTYFLPEPGSTYWVWDRHPGDLLSQRIFVTTFPMPSGEHGLSYAFTRVAQHGSTGPVTVLERSPIRLCGTLDGVFVSLAGSGTHGKMAEEAVITSVRRRAYAAIYVRGASQAARPDAEAAIRSLCPTR